MIKNIYELPALPISEEHIAVLAETDSVRAERIVSAGHTTGWLDQSETELVILIEGNAVIEFENKKIELSRGDTLLIKPHERHRVACTSASPPCVWLCVFYDE